MEAGSKPLLFIGNIAHSVPPYKIQTFENGFVIVKNGKILAIDKFNKLEKYRTELKIDEFQEIKLSESQVLIPGLIDTHIHASQYPNLGVGLDRPLLEWLEQYTFPLERKFQDAEFAQKVYDLVVKKTLACGTTTACYFATIHGNTSVLLADSAIKYGQRAFVGKVNMTNGPYPDYVEGREDIVEETTKFVEAVLNKNSNLVKPIITPRFALSLAIEDMALLADIAKKYQLNIQSHIAENTLEVRQVEQRFGMSYSQVYERANLLTDKTILAHGIYLSDADIELLRKKHTSISHCPNSNTFLESGIFDFRRFLTNGIKVGLGTDVAGGNSCSMIDVMRGALFVSINHRMSDDDIIDIDFVEHALVFHMATIGGARALHIDNVTGNFEVNKDFDALVIDLDVSEGPSDLFSKLNALQLLKRFIFNGDDRNVVQVYVAGRRVK